MVIDGQYKEEMKQALLLLLQENLTIDLTMSSNSGGDYTGDSGWANVSVHVRVYFDGKEIASSSDEASIHL